MPCLSRKLYLTRSILLYMDWQYHTWDILYIHNTQYTTALYVFSGSMYYSR